MERVKEIMKGSMILLGLLISGCSLANNNDWLAGDLRGMNHTTSEITRFSVDGYGGWGEIPVVFHYRLSGIPV
nr:hypothetical protein [Xenorhabdus sp. ZM]